MTTEPPYWLSWLSDIGGVLGMLVLIGTPLHRWLLPKLRNWKAKKSQSGRTRRLAELQRELSRLERITGNRKDTVNVISWKMFYALIFLVAPYALAGFIHILTLILNSDSDLDNSLSLFDFFLRNAVVFRLLQGCFGLLFLITVLEGFFDVIQIIYLPESKDYVLREIKEFQELDEQQRVSTVAKSDAHHNR